MPLFCIANLCVINELNVIYSMHLHASHLFDVSLFEYDFICRWIRLPLSWNPTSALCTKDVRRTFMRFANTRKILLVSILKCRRTLPFLLRISHHYQNSDFNQRNYPWNYSEISTRNSLTAINKTITLNHVTDFCKQRSNWVIFFIIRNVGQS